jgi:hypothetical protein
VQAIAAASPTATAASVAWTRGERPIPNTRAKAAKQAAAAVAWPDGKDGPLNPVKRSMSGRARSTIHLIRSATPN